MCKQGQRRFVAGRHTGSDRQAVGQIDIFCCSSSQTSFVGKLSLNLSKCISVNCLVASDYFWFLTATYA